MHCEQCICELMSSAVSVVNSHQTPILTLECLFLICSTLGGLRCAEPFPTLIRDQGVLKFQYWPENQSGLFLVCHSAGSAGQLKRPPASLATRWAVSCLMEQHPPISRAQVSWKMYSYVFKLWIWSQWEGSLQLPLLRAPTICLYGEPLLCKLSVV